ncbi:MAG TPA: hypothetical protein VF941_06660, partial [Clostridia bacterium]
GLLDKSDPDTPLFRMFFYSLIKELIFNSIYFVLSFIAIIIVINIYNRTPKLRIKVAIEAENTTEDCPLHEANNYIENNSIE